MSNDEFDRRIADLAAAMNRLCADLAMGDVNTCASCAREQYVALGVLRGCWVVLQALLPDDGTVSETNEGPKAIG